VAKAMAVHERLHERLHERCVSKVIPVHERQGNACASNRCASKAMPLHTHPWLPKHSGERARHEGLHLKRHQLRHGSLDVQDAAPHV